MNFKKTFIEIQTIASFAWGHFRRGYGAGVGFFLGIFNALNIVVLDLKVFIPNISIITLIELYLVGFISIILVSIGFDFLLLALKFIQKEYLLGTRDNPTIDVPIGKKEILNYQSTIAALGREVQNYEVQIAICKALGIQDKVPILEQNIRSAGEYKTKMEDILSKAMI